VIVAQRLLVVEDDPDWQYPLQDHLRDLFQTTDLAEDLDQAWLKLQTHEYDLVVLDLSLVARSSQDFVPNEKGFVLLTRLRQRDRESSPAIVIVTGYSTTKRMLDAFTEHRVDDFVEKTPQGASFDGDEFARRIAHVLLKARIRKAGRRVTDRVRNSLLASTERFLSTELYGPDEIATRVLDATAVVDFDSFGSRADAINDLLRKSDPAWRAAAKEIGTDLYEALVKNPVIAEFLQSAFAKSTGRDPSLLEITGPAELLRIPFELLWNANDYICLNGLITRRLTLEGMTSRKSGSFHEFVGRLVEAGEPVNILLIGVNSDGRIDGAEQEVWELEQKMKEMLEAAAISFTIEKLVGANATFDQVRDHLATSKVHILHYAGHGRFDMDLPERSGILLGLGKSTQRLTAAQLKQMLTGSDVRLAFFNCCLGAQTGQELGEGDFHGTLEAVARADVPIIIGHRWVVPDQPARQFAIDFHQALWRTLSPGLSILRARTAAANQPKGRFNWLWASPVIASQVQP